ncbi:hypothetical protein D9M71_457050 [compost metagenome]
MHAGEVIHDPAGDWATDHARQRNGDEPQHGHARTPIGRKPVGQVQQQTRRKTRFGNAKQKAQGIELPRGFDEGEQGGDDAPGDHDASDPDPRTDLVQDDVAGNFAEEIADEKHARAQSVNRFAERQIVHHLQFGKTDVDPIQIGAQVAQHQKGHQAPRGFTVGVGAHGRNRFERQGSHDGLISCFY